MKTLNKSKIVGVAAVSLAAVSLIGVGFASWVITGIKGTIASPEVSVTVGDVRDNRAEITATIGDGSLCFDAPKDDKTGPIIYKPGTGTTGEDLEFSFTVSADQVVGGTINVNAAIEGYNTSSGIGKAINDGYLTAPKLKNSSDVLLGAGATEIGTLTSSATSATYTFEFGWGSKFGGINPSLYADNKNVDTVLTELNKFKAISIGNIKITVTADFVATSA